MRDTFITYLYDSERKDIYLLVGDVGFSVIEKFEARYPDQYLNAGIAEQNMTGVAAGLALCGKKVITYSIANFNTMRCIEQIRNDICYHNLDVSIVSVGGGFLYGSAGYSHHAIQDIAVMGALPYMTLLLPADRSETKLCMEYIMNHAGPKYLRLGKNGEVDIHTDSRVLMKINVLCVQQDIDARAAIVVVGTIAAVAMSVQSELFQKDGVIVDVITCPIIDSEFTVSIRTKLSKYKQVFVMEEHVECFGFASMVRKALEGCSISVYSRGTKRDLPKKVGDQVYLREQHGLDVKGILDWIKEKNNE